MPGFSDAWAETSPGLDSAAAAFATDESDIKGRDLDARSRSWKVAAVIAAALCLGAWFAYDQGLFENEPAEVSEQDLVPSLIAPDVQRSYDPAPTSVTLEVSARGDSLFLRSGADPNPQPFVEPQELLVPAFTAGPVIWAGRTHIALTGPGLAETDICLVATLVTDDLRTVDLAAAGTCPVENAVTGDRIACQGRQALLLEVWPFDPRSATRPPETSATLHRRHRQTNWRPISALRRRFLAMRKSTLTTTLRPLAMYRSCASAKTSDILTTSGGVWCLGGPRIYESAQR